MGNDESSHCSSGVRTKLQNNRVIFTGDVDGFDDDCGGEASSRAK